MVRGDFLTPPEDIVDEFVMPNKCPALLSTTIEFISRCILITGRVPVWSVWVCIDVMSGACGLVSVGCVSTGCHVPVVWSGCGGYRREVGCMWSGQGVMGIDVMSCACDLVRVWWVST